MKTVTIVYLYWIINFKTFNWLSHWSNNRTEFFFVELWKIRNNSKISTKFPKLCYAHSTRIIYLIIKVIDFFKIFCSSLSWYYWIVILIWDVSKSYCCSTFISYIIIIIFFFLRISILIFLFRKLFLNLIFFSIKYILFWFIFCTT